MCSLYLPLGVPNWAASTAISTRCGALWHGTTAEVNAGPVESEVVMHAKYMHELCSLLMHIPIYYNVISFYNHVL
jgi:hypothetical protein